VNNAYEVLGNEDKRKQYDVHGAEGPDMGFGGAGGFDGFGFGNGAGGFSGGMDAADFLRNFGFGGFGFDGFGFDQQRMARDVEVCVLCSCSSSFIM